jgi:limonene-1,2-epoxide hydrolase
MALFTQGEVSGLIQANALLALSVNSASPADFDVKVIFYASVGAQIVIEKLGADGQIVLWTQLVGCLGGATVELDIIGVYLNTNESVRVRLKNQILAGTVQASISIPGM